MRTDLLEHPAVKAWIELRPDRVEPESIEILDRERTKAWIELRAELDEPIESLDGKERAWIKLRSRHVRPEIAEILSRKRFIYRLKGVGREGSAVIAKQCKKDDGTLQHTVYKEILSGLPISTLSCYGFVEDPSGELCWLFLEDAGTDVFSSHSSKHRTLAARWLAHLHTSALRVAATARLPNRGPDYYLKHLRLARDTIERAVVDSAFSPDELVVLKSIVSQYGAVEASWSKVEKFCDRMPQTLVHGDFRQSNVRVRNGRTGMALLPFDWEKAGQGVPAADLAQLEPTDLATYFSVVRGSWPHLGVRDIRQMASIGGIFRGLAAISWERWQFEHTWEDWGPQYSSLKHELIKQAVVSMRVYTAWIEDGMRATTWEN